jgi:hypothetical protein
MKCSICGIRIGSLEEAAEEGWEPYFYDGETEYELACPGCAETFLHEGEDGEMELKDEYRGKLRYIAKRTPEPPQEHLAIGIAVLENEPEKLN